jgi:hypothetical protein
VDKAIFVESLRMHPREDAFQFTPSMSVNCFVVNKFFVQSSLFYKLNSTQTLPETNYFSGFKNYFLLFCPLALESMVPLRPLFKSFDPVCGTNSLSLLVKILPSFYLHKNL